MEVNVRLLTSLALVLAVGLPACDRGGSVLRPTTPIVPPAPRVQEDIQQEVVGEWRGSSSVVSASGLPECAASFWRVGFSDSVSIELLKHPAYERDQYDLHLRQQASREFCHLNARIDGESITAKSWDEDGLGYEGEAWCHFRLDTSDWGYRGTAAEVWILGIRLTGSFSGESKDSIHGSMDVPYHHRPGNSALNESYADAMIVKTFEVLKVSP